VDVGVDFGYRDAMGVFEGGVWKDAKVEIQSAFFEIDVDGCSEHLVDSAKNEPDERGPSRIEGSKIMYIEVSLLCVLAPVPLSSSSRFLLPQFSQMADSTDYYDSAIP
jgi:hypothetical protein